MKLELRGLTKRFGSFVANDHIDLCVESGEIHCILGENGAGKTTLMNMLYGLLAPDEGTILIDDQPLLAKSPRDSINAGIGMVHQHFMLVPVFTVAENIMLGREQTKGLGVLDRTKARSLVRELSTRYGLEVDPDKLVEDIPVGVQQRVEIIKALVNEAKILILDEPTAVLTPQEIDELIDVMRSLKEAGTTILFITHKLEEVRAIADRITVIRRGQVVDTVEPATSAEDLAELMVGRAVELTVDKKPAEAGEAKLVVNGLTVVNTAGQPVVDDVSFDVRGGEIFAIAGVQGNGQSELVRALIGLEKPVRGDIELGGESLLGRTPYQRLRSGIGYIPEDRSLDGYVGSFSVAENLMLDLYRREPFSKNGVLSPAKVRQNANHRVEEFDVRTQSIDEPVSSLSGGNQQKVVLARELSRPLELLIAGQPTRGLDVGSIEFVHNRLVRERDQGTAVLMVSTELEEITSLADRIAVMCGGRIVGIVPGDTPFDQLGLMMGGSAAETAAKQAEEHPTTLGSIVADTVADTVEEGGPDDDQ